MIDDKRTTKAIMRRTLRVFPQDDKKGSFLTRVLMKSGAFYDLVIAWMIMKNRRVSILLLVGPHWSEVDVTTARRRGGFVSV